MGFSLARPPISRHRPGKPGKPYVSIVLARPSPRPLSHRPGKPGNQFLSMVLARPGPRPLPTDQENQENQFFPLFWLGQVPDLSPQTRKTRKTRKTSFFHGFGSARSPTSPHRPGKPGKPGKPVFSMVLARPGPQSLPTDQENQEDERRELIQRSRASILNRNSRNDRSITQSLSALHYKTDENVDHGGGRAIYIYIYD